MSFRCSCHKRLQPKKVYPSWSPWRPWPARDILPQIILRNGHSLITFGIRGSQPVHFHEDCEPGVSVTISRKAGGVEITDLEANTARSGSKIELRHVALREPQSKKPSVPSAPTREGCVRESRCYT